MNDSHFIDFFADIAYHKIKQIYLQTLHIFVLAVFVLFKYQILNL